MLQTSQKKKPKQKQNKQKKNPPKNSYLLYLHSTGKYTAAGSGFGLGLYASVLM